MIFFKLKLLSFVVECILKFSERVLKNGKIIFQVFFGVIEFFVFNGQVSDVWLFSWKFFFFLINFFFELINIFFEITIHFNKWL